MRRKDKEITNAKILIDIISSSQVCRLAMTDNDMPYITPLCFGYEKNTLYFHSATEGKKIDILRKNPQVCFTFDRNIDVVSADTPCAWGMKYQSVIGYGKAVFLQDCSEKRKALQLIFAQYSAESASFNDSAIRATTVFKVHIDHMTGKQAED